MADTYLYSLDLPCPPHVEEVFGFQGDARYVAFHWQPSGDEFMWETGWSSADGHWSAWLTFSDHPTCSRILREWHFGDSDTPATHWLLLDRTLRTWAVAPAKHVVQILRRWVVFQKLLC